MKYNINIRNCIIVGDTRRLKAGKEPIWNFRRLSYSLEELDEEKYDSDKIYQNILYKSNNGFEDDDMELIKDIQVLLHLTEDEIYDLDKYLKGIDENVRVCLNCGKDISNEFHLKKFCSKKCANANYTRKCKEQK